jgi:hypothetical protein
MLFTIILFFIAIVIVFGMLSYRAWELRTARKSIPDDGSTANVVPDLSFRHVEKNMLYLAKHVLQSVLLFVIKWWFILIGKFKKWAIPKINNYFGKKEEDTGEPKRLSFWKRAILESKAKVRRMKERVKREQEEKEREVEVV